MSTKQSNIEATRIYRPITLGQVTDKVEACVIAIIDIVMGENLLPPFAESKLWRSV